MLLLAAGCSLPSPGDLDTGGSSSEGTSDTGPSPTDATGTTTTAATTLDATDTDVPGETDGPHDTGETDGPPVEPDCWNVTVLVDDASRSPARALAVQEDGLVLAGSPTPDAVGQLGPDGTELWSYGAFGSEALPIWPQEVVPLGEGSNVIAGQRFAPELPSSEALWVARLDADGSLAWQEELGPAHFMGWDDIDVRWHPDGGFIVSSHDSLDGGEAPRLLTFRLDELGQTVWSLQHPLVGDAPIGINWSQGAMDLLPSGDIVQLTAAEGGIRVLRITADGDVVWDQTIATGTWPQDLVALPDGDVFVMTMDPDDADLLRLGADGSVKWERRYHEGPNSSLSAMAWDPGTERLLAVGGTRGNDAGDQAMWERTWILALDADGEVRWSHVGEPGTPAHATDVVLDPATPRLSFSAHGEALYIGEIEPCTE